MLTLVNPLNGVFGEAWQLYRAHWAHFTSIALVVFLALAAIGIVLGFLLGDFGVFLGWLVSVAGTFWLQGTLIEAVNDVRDGRADLSLADTFGRVFPKLGTIVVAGVMLAIALAIGFALLVVPGLILMTIWIAVIPAIVLENRGIGESFGRSRELVRGNGWNVFGAIVLTIALLIAVWLVAALLLSPLDAWLAALVHQIVWAVVVAPFVVAIWALIYFRLREAKEPAVTPEPAPGPPP
jgi:hypothetical protein